MHYPDRTVISSFGHWTWHPGRNELSYMMTDRAGGLTQGVTTFLDSKTFRTEAVRFGPGGSTAMHRDDNVVISEALHRNETFRLDGGRPTSGGIYEWRREIG